MHRAFLWEYKSSAYQEIKYTKSFYYKSGMGYGISSATLTEAGNLLVLERKYKINSNEEGRSLLDFETKVRFVSKKAIDNIVSGSVVSGQDIIYIFNKEDSEYIVSDDFEAIASRTVDDITSVFLVSDDNFSDNQKTILLQFSFNEGVLADFLEEEGDCVVLGKGHQEMDYNTITPD